MYTNYNNVKNAFYTYSDKNNVNLQIVKGSLGS